MLPKGSTRSLKTKPPMGSVLLPTQHFRRVTTELQARSAFPLRPVNLSRSISANENTHSGFHGQFYPITKLQNGVCVNSRGVLGGFGYHWGRRTWTSGQTLSRHVFGFTTCGHDLLGSIKSRMFMSPFGVKALVKGCGRGLRICCSLTSGSTTVLAGFMFRRNGIKCVCFRGQLY